MKRCDGGGMPATGVKIEDASRLTGLTISQLRWRVRRDLIRHRRAGRYVVFHPEDIAALAGSMWTGRPIAAVPVGLQEKTA